MATDNANGSGSEADCTDTVRLVKLVAIKASHVLSATFSAGNYYSAWNPATTYKRGDVVLYNNMEMVCQQATSTNELPLYMKPNATYNAGLVPTKVLMYHDGTGYHDYPRYDPSYNYPVGAKYYDPRQQNLVFQVLVAGVNKKPPVLSYDEMTLKSDFAWAKLGEDNYLSWLNGRTAKQSLQGASTAVIELQPGRPFTSIDLFNVRGGKVTVLVTDEANNSAFLYTETKAAREGSAGLWEYFFKKSRPRTSLHFDIGHSGYRNKKVRITIEGAADAGLAMVGLGFPFTLGRMSLPSYAAAESKSPIAQNPYGNTYISRKDTVVNIDLPVKIKSERFDEMFRTVVPMVGNPVIIYGDNTYETLVSYGMLQRFKQTLARGHWTDCEIKLEKLL